MGGSRSIYRPTYTVTTARPAEPAKTRNKPPQPLTVALLGTSTTGQSLRCEVNGYNAEALRRALRQLVSRTDPSLRFVSRKVDGALIVWTEAKPAPGGAR